MGLMYCQNQPDGSVHVFNMDSGRVEVVVRRDDSVTGDQSAIERLNRMKMPDKPLSRYVRECALRYSGVEQ